MFTRDIVRRVPILVLVLLLAGCGDERPPALESPTQVHLSSGSDDTQEGDLRLITGRMPADLPTIEVSSLIGSSGGSLNIAGHSLVVPRGAVRNVTLFTLTLGTEGYVEAKLSAVEVDLLGNVLDIGSGGFVNPVTLTLSYAWAEDVEDPKKLTIVKRESDGTLTDKEGSVSERGKTVSVQLENFSSYAMASM